MIAAVKRLPAGKPIKRVFHDGLTPYTTSTGIQIGVFYEPPQKNHMTDLEEFWQGVLLGIEPMWSDRRVAKYVSYSVFVSCVIMTAVKVGW
jgi:hypothetical protein